MEEKWNFIEKDGHNIIKKYAVQQSKGISIIVAQNQQCDKIRRSPSIWLKNWFKDVFLPHGYPDSVSPDYIHYQIWDTLQAYCSSVAGAVSLHASLGSLGVGVQGATPLAATITWLTNTGAGMIASIVFSYAKGSQLDANNKQWRLFADFSNDLAHLMKLSAPLMGLPPVIPLTVAALLHSLVGVAGGATRAALTAHQARRNNLGDVSAKDGSQENVVNLGALITSLFLLPAITHSISLTWIVFLILLNVHLYCNYRAVRAVVALSINRPRLLIILDEFNESRCVPSPRICNASEPLWHGPAFSRDYLCPGWRLEMGCCVERCVHLGAALTPHSGRTFMMTSVPGCVLVLLYETARPADLLLASHAALLLAKSVRPSEVASAYDIQRSLTEATQSFPVLEEQLKLQGWESDKLFLGVGESRLLE